MKMKSFRIIIADDDDDDFLLIKEAFRELNLEHFLIRKSDGVQLLDYLLQVTKEHKALPDLILLDINMPKMDGIEVLEKINTEKAYKTIPVIIYSTSNCPDQKEKCLRLGAQAFVTKGSTYKKVMAFVARINNFLKEGSRLPGLFMDIKYE